MCINFCECVFSSCGYFSLAIIISIVVGYCYFKSKDKNYQESIFNMMTYLLGFFLVYLDYLLFDVILRAEHVGILSAYVFLFIVLLFWTAFCLSGRGIEIIQAGLDRGFEANFTWKGVSIKVSEKNNSNNNLKEV